MSMCRVFSWVVGRGCLLWPVCSLGKTLLAIALLHSVLQGQICLNLLTNLPVGLTDWTTPPATFQTFSKAWFSFHIPECASQHGVKHLCALATTGCSLGCHTCRAPISPNPRSPLTWDSRTRAGKGPGNEHWTNKPPPTEFRNGQKVTPHVQLLHTILHTGILAKQGVDHQKGLWAKMIGWRQPGNSETAGHMAEQFSWVPLLFCSLPRHPFPVKSLAMSACVFPWTVHFWVLDKSPLFRSWKGSPFLQ